MYVVTTMSSSYKDLLEIDCNYLQGDGQILRNALSFSCILKQPIRLINIRLNHSNPGLNQKDLHLLNLLIQITNAEVSGNLLSSTEIEFKPAAIKAGKYILDTKSPTSITQILLCALPVLVFGEDTSRLELIGGTNVSEAPQLEFITEVLKPNLYKFDILFDYYLKQRGYQSHGKGCCRFLISYNKNLRCATINSFGDLHEILGWCYVAGNLNKQLADNIKLTVENELKSLKCPTINLTAYKESAEKANGCGCILKAVTTTDCVLGSDSLDVIEEFNTIELALTAANRLKNQIVNKICVDEYVQDQLILYMALAEGKSEILTGPLTNHTLRAIYVAEKMCGLKFKINNLDVKHVRVSCCGIGHASEY